MPRNVVAGLAFSTLRNTRGRNAIESSAWRLRMIVVSVSAPPTMKSHAASGSRFFARATSSVVVNSSADASVFLAADFFAAVVPLWHCSESPRSTNPRRVYAVRAAWRSAGESDAAQLRRRLMRSPRKPAAARSSASSATMSRRRSNVAIAAAMAEPACNTRAAPPLLRTGPSTSTCLPLRRRPARARAALARGPTSLRGSVERISPTTERRSRNDSAAPRPPSSRATLRHASADRRRAERAAR